MTDMDTKSICDSKRIANQFIRHFIGRIKLDNNYPETHLMLRCAQDIIRNHKYLLDEMCTRLHIRKENAKEIYKEVVSDLFVDSFNWGRVITLFAFSGLVAKCIESDEVIHWLQDELVSRDNLIIEHGEWTGFLLQFDDRSSCWLKWLRYLLLR